jgi:hypothetical protein
MLAFRMNPWELYGSFRVNAAKNSVHLFMENQWVCPCEIVFASSYFP